MRTGDAMNEADAKHAVELYETIREVDRNIAKAKQAHSIKVEAWWNSAADSHCVKLELGEHSIVVRDILIKEMQALRTLRGDGLKRMGFDVPIPESTA